MKPLRIFTPVFGQKHINWLSRALGRSLSWSHNRKAIDSARWCLFIHRSEFEAVMQVVTKVLPPEQIETIEATESLSDLTRYRGILMCQAFVKAMKLCINDGSQMLISTPDFIWADGSIGHMRSLAKQKDSCIAVPHPRATPDILSALDGLEAAGQGARNFPELVALARQHSHGSWGTSEYGKHSGSFKGGILWRDMGHGVQALQHRMPSPYLCNFVHSDIELFTPTDPQEPVAWGVIDHSWAVRLCEADRWRMVLSSDIAFMAEVTEATDNVPPHEPPNPTHPDSFWTQERQDHLLHHKLNRQFIAGFRAEDS